MNNPKADAALNLSLSLPESLHEKSTSLSAVLTVIIKLKYCRRKMDFSLLLEMKNRKPS